MKKYLTTLVWSNKFSISKEIEAPSAYSALNKVWSEQSKNPDIYYSDYANIVSIEVIEGNN